MLTRSMCAWSSMISLSPSSLRVSSPRSHLAPFFSVSGNIQLPIYVKPSITYASTGAGRVHIMVGAKLPVTGDRQVTNIVVLIPFPKCMRSASLTANVGTVRIDPLTQVARWEIGKLPKEIAPVLEGTVTMPVGYAVDEVPTVRAEFAVKMLAASGLKVDGLAIRGVAYKPFKGVRSVTQAGKFTIRCGEP
jgi:AP-3 complex subunit mu